MTGNTHILRAVTALLDIPMPRTPLKQAKEEILRSLHFTTMPVEISKFLVFNRDKYNDLSYHIRQEVEADHKVTLRFIDDNGEKGGGYPITHITSPSEYTSLTITDEEGELIALQNAAGDHVQINDFNLIHLFSRHKSIFGTLGNFGTNLVLHNTILKRVKLGGGFRMQIDNLREIDDQLYYDFSFITVYNDEAPRKASLNALRTLYTSTPFNAMYLEDKLVPSPIQFHELNEVLERKDAQIFAHQLINTILAHDGHALANLFNALLSVDPQLKRHSIEGVFTTVEAPSGKPTLYFEIIDFDGIDTLPAIIKRDTVPSMTNLRIFEQYSAGYIHLLLAKWLKSKSID